MWRLSISAVVFDAPGKNVQGRLVREYKATRSAMPRISAQIPPIHQVWRRWAGHLMMTLEADDVIARSRFARPRKG